MFRRLKTPADTVTIYLDGEPVRAAADESVAAALLAAGVVAFRTSAETGAPRAPHCMISNCFECLLEIDGEPNRQACLVAVREGMQVQREIGERRA